MSVKIYIDGQMVNYFSDGDLPISLNFSIEDAEDPSKITGSHSNRSIKLPADKHNLGVFGMVNINASTTKTKWSCTIEVDGIICFEGTAQLESTELLGNTYDFSANEISLILLGNNATWFEDLKSLQITEVGLIPRYINNQYFIYQHSNANPDTQGFGFILAKSRDWIYAGHVTSWEHEVFVFVRKLLKEGFRKVGFRLESDFLDTDFAKRLIVPILLNFQIPEGVDPLKAHYADTNNGTPFPASTVTLVVLHNKVYDEGHFYSTVTGKYTAMETGYFIIGTPSPSSGVSFFIRLNGVVYPAFTDPCELGYGVQQTVSLVDGDEVELVCFAFNAGIISDAFLYIRPTAIISDTGDFVVPETMRDENYTVANVVSAITPVFNLMWITDFAAKTVRVEPRDNYVLKIGGVETQFEGYRNGFIDHTRKLDLNKSAVVSLLPKNNTLFMSWASDSTDANVSKIDEAPFKLFDVKATLSADYHKGGETKVETVASKTVMIRDNTPKHESSPTDIILPCFLSNLHTEPNPDRGVFGLRLLWFAGQRSGIDGYVKFWGQSSPYAVPYSFMVNYHNLGGDDPILSLGDIVDGTTTGLGLASRFHIHSIYRLDWARKMKLNILLTTLDVLNFEWSRKVLLNSTSYIVEKVSGFKPERRAATSVELIEDVLPPDGYESNITHSPVKGLIE